MRTPYRAVTVLCVLSCLAVTAGWGQQDFCEQNPDIPSCGGEGGPGGGGGGGGSSPPPDPAQWLEAAIDLFRPGCDVQDYFFSVWNNSFDYDFKVVLHGRVGLTCEFSDPSLCNAPPQNCCGNNAKPCSRCWPRLEQPIHGRTCAQSGLSSEVGLTGFHNCQQPGACEFAGAPCFSDADCDAAALGQVCKRGRCSISDRPCGNNTDCAESCVQPSPCEAGCKCDNTNCCDLDAVWCADITGARVQAVAWKYVLEPEVESSWKYFDEPIEICGTGNPCPSQSTCQLDTAIPSDEVGCPAGLAPAVVPHWDPQSVVCSCTSSEAGACGDAIDNDCDGLEDCWDPECYQDPACTFDM